MKDLEKYCTDITEFKGGASKKYILNIDDEKYFFKMNYSIFQQNFIEVFTSKLLTKLGVENVVDYNFASYQGNEGCISKTYKSSDVKSEITFMDILAYNYYFKKTGILAPLNKKLESEIYDETWDGLDGFEDDVQYDFSCEQICNEVETFCLNNDIALDKRKLYNRIREVATIDYFIANADRNCSNIAFLIKGEDNNLNCEIAPIFDNGESFLFNSSDIDNKDFNKILTRISVSDVGIHYSLKENKYLKDGNLIIADIFEMTKQNKEIGNLVNKFLSLNIEEEIVQFEIEQGKVFPVEIKEQMVKVFNARINHYKELVSKLNKKIEKEK